jgi:hypothetical protein
VPNNASQSADDATDYSSSYHTHIPLSCSMSLDKVQLPGVAGNVLLAAGAVLLNPALDSLLISGFPDSLVTTLGGRISDLTYSKRLASLEPTAKGYDIVTPFVETTKSIPSSMQPSSMSTGVMFGVAACFLSLVAAGTFLVRTHADSQSGRHSSPAHLRSLSETLAYNREQRQAQDGRAVPRRRGGRGREFSHLIFG